jgi:SAM-dependent methyltransferase
VESEYYRTRYSYDPGRAAVWRAISEHLQVRFFPGSDLAVADLGCGYGDFINQVTARDRYAVDAADVSSHLREGIRFFRRDLTDLSPIEDESLDVVFSSNVFEHLTKTQLQAVAGEVKRTLKPGGLLILIQPNYRLCYRNYFDDYTHETVFSDVSLRDFVASAGFSIRCVKPRFLPFSMKSRIPRSYILTKLYLALRVPVAAKQMLLVAER